MVGYACRLQARTHEQSSGSILAVVGALADVSFGATQPSAILQSVGDMGAHGQRPILEGRDVDLD